MSTFGILFATGGVVTGSEQSLQPRSSLEADRYGSVWLYGIGMVKVTFTLDEATVERLRQAAARARKPQSQVVREAVKDYADRVGRLSEEERMRLLKVFDTVVPAIPLRPAARVDAELQAIRSARRKGGR